MKLDKRIDAFAQLGNALRELSQDEFKLWAANSQSLNPWFTEPNFMLSLQGVCAYLERAKLEKWVSQYDLNKPISSQKVGVVMAGNIPMVGFHDYLSVLISDHHAVIKLSSKDQYLLPLIHKKLIHIEPFFATKVTFAEQLKEVDAYIATGSNNTARYFKQYFAKKPHIIRRSRTSVAILKGDESKEELEQLSNDIFQYFGLGCRNVTYIMVPENYDWTPFFEACAPWEYIMDHTRYRNNYEYNRSVLLVNASKHLDNGFLLVQPHENIHSPIGVMNYGIYTTPEERDGFLSTHKEDIQCIVGKDHIPFGTSQQPEVWDYADGVDTLAFLASL